MGEALIELELLKDLFWHGIIQSALLWIPLLKPLVEDWVPPWWWLACYYNEHWQENLDAERRPTELFMHYWWRCWLQHLHFLINLSAKWITQQFQDLILALLGALHESYETFAEWIQALMDRVGGLLPDWATSLIDGLLVLWDLLPESIRGAVQTWEEVWGQIQEAVKVWARAWYDEARQFAYELWDWYVNLGRIVTAWWQRAHDQLEEMIADAYGWIARTLGAAWTFLVWFWSNPTGAIATWLSPWWERLVTFASDCLDYWYNIWGSYAEDLAAFLADPLDFLWNRGETWLNRRLEQP